MLFARKMRSLCVCCPKRGSLVACAIAALALLGVLCTGCSGSSSDASSTSGPAFEPPATIEQASFNASAATNSNGCGIDISSISSGYVAVRATSESARLKFQVMNGNMSYNYDLPGDGTPLVCPLNMGAGTYTFRVMQNTSANNYVEIASTSASVSGSAEFEPFVRPNVFCDYTDASECVALARELARDAQNQGDALRAVYGWIVDNISYDTDKAAKLANATGYVPNPDETLASRSGICFDYVSLAAAMLRSLGIPCKIVTGYVSPDGIYHAWNLVYLDGSWESAEVSVKPGDWSRIDLTFAASGSSSYTGDGTTYTERYTY